jgi:hypothetical protein
MLADKGRIKFRIIFSSVIAVGALTVNWLVLGDSSPFHQHFLWHSDLPDLWAAMHIVPVICSAIIAGNPHSGSEIVYGFMLVIQWFIVAFLLSGVLVRLWRS